MQRYLYDPSWNICSGKKVSLTKTILSTDNEGEFGGQERRERKIGFHAQVERYGLNGQ